MPPKKRSTKPVSNKAKRRVLYRSMAGEVKTKRSGMKGVAMKALKASVSRSASWVDPDDAPPWTAEQFAEADLYHGNKLIRRGRPPSASPKHALKLRIDADVVEHFRATGPGWQTRINATLRRAAKRAGR